MEDGLLQLQPEYDLWLLHLCTLPCTQMGGMMMMIKVDRKLGRRADPRACLDTSGEVTSQCPYWESNSVHLAHSLLFTELSRILYKVCVFLLVCTFNGSKNAGLKFKNNHYPQFIGCSKSVDTHILPVYCLAQNNTTLIKCWWFSSTLLFIILSCFLSLVTFISRRVHIIKELGWSSL